MGFYFRKSTNLGPIRLNFSKSGVGVSTGIKGARLVFSRKGTYVHLGRNGFYYRKNLSFSDTSNRENEPTQPSSVNLNYSNERIIETTNFNSLIDIDSQDFINELENKDKKIALSSIFLFLGSLLFLVFILFFTLPYDYDTLNKNYAKITKEVVNIRDIDSISGSIIQKSNKGEEFLITNDSLKNDWLEIDIQGNKGYVHSGLVEKVVKTNVIASKARYKDSKVLTLIFILFYISLFVFGYIKLRGIDIKRKSIELYYDLDDEMNELYSKFIQAFVEFSKVNRVWKIYSQSNDHDTKHNAGASTLIKRYIIRNFSINKLPARFFRTNASIPFIDLNNIKLYFLPERLLIKKFDSYAAIMYKNLSFN
jgi:hypothetical protein